MNNNNFKQFTAKEFVEKLEGNDNDFIDLKPEYRFIRSLASNKGQDASISDSERIIYISTPLERSSDKLIRSFLTKDSSEYPDFNSPIVYEISEKIKWDRGLNHYTGEAEKPELGYGINLSDCIFKRPLYIVSVRYKGDLIINKCSFGSENNEDAELEISSSKFKTVQLTDIKGNYGADKPLKKIKITALETDQLIFYKIKLDHLHIDCEDKYIDNITFYECEFRTITIKGNKVGSLGITNTTIHSRISINININDCLISNFYYLNNQRYPCGSLDINFRGENSGGQYTIRDTTIESFAVSGINSGKILIKDCEIVKFSFEDFTNNGNFKMHNINNLKKFIILVSSLGKAELLNVDLSQSIETQIVDSNLLEIIYTNTIFPENLIAKTKDDFKGIREVFRQLKFSHSKQGNRIQELKYEALEMDAYQKDTVSVKSKNEKFILFFNSLTNDHGQSWTKPLKWLLLTVPLFILLKCAFGYTLVWGVSGKELSQYLEFVLNPLHNFESLFKSEIEYNRDGIGLAKIIDILSKLISGLLLFQMIRAFRKYVK